MKVRVIAPFNDKETGKLHNTNEVFEATPERVAEIKKAGRFVVEVDEEEKQVQEQEEKPVKTATRTTKTAKK